MTEMLSFGAGVNSIAMTIMLVEQGWEGPIVMADTSAEWPETYCYMTYFQNEFLKPRGLEITRLSPATHAELYDDKRLGGLADTLEDYCLKRGVIPILAVRWCTIQFKRNPLENWREAHGLVAGIILLLLAAQLRWWRMRTRDGSTMRLRVKGTEYEVRRK